MAMCLWNIEEKNLSSTVAYTGQVTFYKVPEQHGYVYLVRLYVIKESNKKYWKSWSLVFAKLITPTTISKYKIIIMKWGPRNKVGAQLHHSCGPDSNLQEVFSAHIGNYTQNKKEFNIFCYASTWKKITFMEIKEET